MTEVARMSARTADTLMGGPVKPVTDGDLDHLVWLIDRALASLPRKAQRVFAAEFCGDEIPSVMDGVPVPDATELPMPEWESA